jgi:hypothetical protein
MFTVIGKPILEPESGMAINDELVVNGCPTALNCMLRNCELVTAVPGLGITFCCGIANVFGGGIVEGNDSFSSGIWLRNLVGGAATGPPIIPEP